jgi:hypothetical protein
MDNALTDSRKEMIIRTSADHLLLITQPDHAALAGMVMSFWRADEFADSSRRDLVLFATWHHDDGWLEVDRAPLVDGSGAMLDFISAPEHVRLGIWPRAAERLREKPYSAALVAQHALHIYERYRRAGLAGAFFDEMEALRDHYLALAAPLTLNDLLGDYFFVRMGDTLSLTFCNGWTEPHRVRHCEIRLEGSRLTVSPDPFGGREIPMAVKARRLPNRPLTEAQAAALFEDAAIVTLSGVASGPQFSQSPER